MIREYALEPGLLGSWKDFRYFVEKFSVAQGRLISEFPKHWKRLVYEACETCSPIEKARITEKMKGLNDRLIRRTRLYDTAKDWLNNAINAHHAWPFHAIIARTAVAGCAEVLEADDLGEAHPLWKEERSKRFDRTPTEIARIAATLLEISREIIFIDPNFRPDSKNFRMPLEKLLAVIAGRSGAPPIRLEYHVGDGDKYPRTMVPLAQFETECRTNLPRCIPRNLQLKFVRWKQTSVHNRYILTERGAIDFGTGLDKATSTGTQDDVAKLLDESVRQDLWEKHVTGTAAVRLVPASDAKNVVIAGAG